MTLSKLEKPLRRFLSFSRTEFDFEAKKVKAFWQIGRFLAGQTLSLSEIKKLAHSLEIETAFLSQSVPFHQKYQNKKPWQTNLSWKQYLLILEIENGEERSFYEHEAVRHGWNLEALQKNLKDRIYQKGNGLGESMILADAGRRGKAVGSLHNHVQVASQTLR